MADRVVRANILTSDSVNSLTWAAEVFYRRLMSIVDDYGRYDGRAEILRGQLYSLKLSNVSKSDIVKWMDECSRAGLVRSYIVEGKEFLEILRFGQRLRAMKSKWPEPCGQMSAIDSSCPPETETETKQKPETENKKQKQEVASLVFLTNEEILKLEEHFQDSYPKAIEILSNYKNSSGKKYKSDYHTLIGWVSEKIIKEKSSAKKESYGGQQTIIGTKAGQQHPLQGLNDLARRVLQSNTGQDS